jgi:hypothetical protein
VVRLWLERRAQLGGFYLVDAPDLDTVVDLCDVLPHGYAVEVRPVADVTQSQDSLEASPA